MNPMHDENYWSRQFDITRDDLNRVAERFERDGTPQDLKEIALRIIRERMEQGDELGPAALSEPTGNINQRAEGILLKHGELILSRLVEALQFDSRFTVLEGKWFIINKLPRIERDALQTVYRILLQNPSSSQDEILALVKEDRSTDQILLRMALHTALRRSPERFENMGTSTRPQWKARLPDVEQAEVTHYAYDPQTYEILCRPGQRLSQKKAGRLQGLNLYAHVVTFAE
jgi:hypothetical protein